MNIQIVPKEIIVHKVIEVNENAAVVACGKWLKKGCIEETTKEITCTKCLKYLAKGGI